jgi:hypothetical protein
LEKIRRKIRHGVCQFVFTKEYYLNSVASPIYINPVGEMDFKGLSTEIMFFNFQEKSGLKWKSFATESTKVL